MDTRIEEIASDHNLCGEGPIWDPVRHRLVWTDISSSLVYHYFPAYQRREVISRGLMVAGIALNDDGALVVAGSGGMHLWRGLGDCTTFLTEWHGEPINVNDMVADARGRIYAGTAYWGAAGMEKTGKLHLVDTDGSARVVEEGVELSNGLGFSPDDRTLYYADSTARRIWAYDVEPRTGTLANRRTFVAVPSTEGIPDGLTVDREGFVWSAQWYGGQVVRYDPDGAVERRLPMPVRQVSSVAFGGEDLADLYITTAAEAWTGPYAPPGYDFGAPNVGGSLYRARVGVQGRLEHHARIRPRG